jgi:hypothetical protein
MSRYRNAVCAKCKDVWFVMMDEKQDEEWLCTNCREPELPIWGCHDPRGGKYAQVCGGLHDPRTLDTGFGKSTQACIDANPTFRRTPPDPEPSPGGCHDTDPVRGLINQHKVASAPIPPFQWIPSDPEPSPEDQMLSDMQEQLQTVRNEKLLAQQELLNSLKSIRDERVRNLDLLRDVIAYQNALKASEESITWCSDLAKKYINQTIDLDFQLHELQNTRWARFKRWMKEQWESEVAL